MEIIDNFLPEEDFTELKDRVFAVGFPWYFNHKMLGYEGYTPKTEEYQFVHMVWAWNRPQSDVFDLIEASMLDRLNIEFLLKIKLNLNPITETHKYRDLFHEDQFGETYGKRKTGVFYLNTNNGYTLFEDGTKVDCVENRMVVFDSHNRHTGVSTTDTKRKVVLNLNWLA